MTTRRIELPFKVKRPILACGADLKGAFALASGREAFLTAGFGDLADLDNFTKYERAVKAGMKKLRITPEIVACDLHPDYFSTRFAEKYALSAKHHTLCKVQHHEAHIASAIVDNSIKGDVIGVAFDGTGYGTDGNIWGGEFFTGGLKDLRRAAHLEYVPMPGGEKAVMEPWRMAASYLYRASGNRFPAAAKRRHGEDLAVLKKMIDNDINSPLTSSAGRLFDAAGSLILAKDTVTKEAELPMELERIADPSCTEKYKISNGTCFLRTTQVIKAITADIAKKVGASVISAKFHNTIAGMILRTSLKLSRKFKIGRIVLSGGVFQNRYLTERVIKLLRSEGIGVYIHHGIPANDSGISVGQIAIANARRQSGVGQARATCA